ncbi:hypothetical protein L226DRAFT_513675 [Lentinus tigrinus ALCF2SS1-7]|nr:hypothetical protein L226DRAFT_513675 [Lentinus tigrinus ALCF2SS1-7]
MLSSEPPGQVPSKDSESLFRPPKLSNENIDDHLHFLIQNYSQLSDDAYDPASILSMLLKRIDRLSPGICVHADHAGRLLNGWEKLRKAFERRDFRAVLYTGALYAPEKTSSRPDNFSTLSKKDQAAAVAAWTLPYQGSADALETAMVEYMRKDAQDGRRYARYAPFMQSSGTGKSRMNDELAKKILYLPINIGKTDCFPPADTEVRGLLMRVKADRVGDWEKQVQLFLCALFETARAHVDEIAGVLPPEAMNPSGLANAFRERMNADMQFGQHGKYRREFYQAVCKKADDLNSCPFRVPIGQGDSPVYTVKLQRDSPDDSEPQETDIMTAAEALADRVSLQYPQFGAYPDKPLVVLCFDEAHMLTEHRDAMTTVTLFEVIRRALHIIRRLPFFTLFVSTVANVEHFPPTPPLHSSSRLRRHLPPFEPIVWTPLDVLAQRMSRDSSFTLAQVASTYHMAHLGRPLFPAMYDSANDGEFRKDIVAFAGKKLLDSKWATPDGLSEDQSLVCLAVRIPLEFDRTVVADSEIELKLVSRHMRLLLYAGTGFSPIITGSSSEPLLAEAAYRAMVRLRWREGEFRGQSAARHGPQTLDPYGALFYHFSHSFLDHGSKGEIIGAVMVLDARDRATTFPLEKDECPPGYSKDFNPDQEKSLHYDGAFCRRIITVMQFLEALLGTANVQSCADSPPCALHATEHADMSLRIAFEYAFIYFNHFVKSKSLEVVNQEYLRLAISRGAAIVCAANHGSIDLIIPILFGTVLEKEKVSAIMIQVKNSRHYTTTVAHSLFTSMNPYECGLFDKNVQEPPPVLRLVFALASSRSAVVAPLPTAQRSEKLERFTAYDIWCAGATHETFSVIQQEEEKHVAKMLQLIRGPREVCVLENGEVHRAVRQMQPMISTHADHFSLWADLSDNMQGPYPLANGYE